MKFWLLTTEYPPFHGGGISTYCYFTADMLAQGGHEVVVFTNDDTIRNFELIQQAEKIRVLRFNSNRQKLHSFLGYSARLSYAFADIVKEMIEKEGKPDYIESQDYLGIGYYITQFKHAGYAFLDGVPVIITLHSPSFIYLDYNRVPVYRFPDFWTGEMEKQSIAAADILISPSVYMVEETKKYMSVREKKMTVIANPFKTQHLPGTTFKRNKIVYYGKLSPQKGSFHLLSYFKQLWDTGFSYALHIIGGTDIVYHPEMKTMGQSVNEKYGPYIKKGLLKLHGKIKPSQINAYLMDAHVIIVPSIVDNLPYVIMEAMSLGKVVLASVQGGQREMLEEGMSGFLFDYNEAATFYDQLKKILALSDDEVQRIGINACQWVKDHNSFDVIRNRKLRELERLKNSIDLNQFPFLYQEEIAPVADKSYSKDLLSVVIPFYNMGAYIDECVQSVCNSSYKEIELLIINDGSTGAAEIEKLKELGKKENITVIDGANRGLAYARNYGAGIAKGEFLAFLDADDKIAPAYYEKAINALRLNDNVFFAGSWVSYFENSSQTWPAFTPQPPYALIHNAVNSSGLVYKRNAFLAGGLNDKKTDYGMEDYESVIHMLSLGFNGIILPEVLFYYRVRSGSMFRNITTGKLLYSNRYIAEKHHSFYAKFAIQIINLLNANGPGYLYDNPTFETHISIKTKGESLFVFKLKRFIKRNNRLKRIVLNLIKIKSKL